MFIDHSTSDVPATPEEMAQALANADAWTDKVFEIKRVFDGLDNTVNTAFDLALEKRSTRPKCCVQPAASESVTD